MICGDCKYRNQDESAWPCKHCTPDDRRYEAETDHEMLRRLELARLREQLAMARLAIIQYGAHDGACSVSNLDDEGRHCSCDCGYEAAIKAAEGKIHNVASEGFVNPTDEVMRKTLNLAREQLNSYKTTSQPDLQDEIESLREQLADSKWERKIDEQRVANLMAQVGELAEERDELVAALNQFAECDLNESNCANLEVATRRIRAVANAALAKLGAGGTGEGS